jgi:hypothetical protein
LWWTDYGARWQDPQLGRWHSIDPLAEKYYAWSGYNYVGNDPINMVDPDGRYQLPDEVAQKYKEFANYINNGIQEVLKSPNIVNGLKKYGQFTDEQIKTMVSPNSGPTIETKTDIPFGGAGYYPGGKDSNIQIDESLLIQFKNANDADKQAALLLIVSTLLHESVHYGDWQDGNPNDNQDALYKLVSVPGEGEFPMHQGSEKGHVFESEVYRNYEWGTTINNIDDAKQVILEKSKTPEGQKDLPTVPK